MTVPLLELRGICKQFTVPDGLFRRRAVHAAADVNVQVRRGEVVALVGESGSGKSTIARIIARLTKADAGALLLDGEDVLKTEPRGASLAYRGRVQMIFQDPFGSLNPVHTVGHHLLRPLQRHEGRQRGRDGTAAPGSPAASPRQRALELLEQVGLSPATDFIDAFPHALSGGQRQRVAIARALAPKPDLLLADEPTSMLDVSVRMDILQLLRRLVSDAGLALVLITHDLASARFLADRILVLRSGVVVESAPTEELLADPQHAYTKRLLAAARRA